MDKKFVLAADTSSIIILEKSGALNKLPGLELLAPNEIIAELEQKNFVTGLYPVIHIKRVDTKPEQDISKKLSVADKKVISLYFTGPCQGILSDDKGILKYCLTNNVPHYCCLSLYPRMYQLDMLEYKEAMTYMNITKEFGRYSEKVVEIAYKMMKKPATD